MANPNLAKEQAKAAWSRGNSRSVPFAAAVELQTILLESARTKDIAPSALAQVARAWSELEERKRILKMRPAPKPIDTTLRTAKPKRSAANGFSEVPSATPTLPQDKPKAGGG